MVVSIIQEIHTFTCLRGYWYTKMFRLKFLLKHFSKYFLNFTVRNRYTEGPPAYSLTCVRNFAKSIGVPASQGYKYPFSK